MALEIDWREMSLHAFMQCCVLAMLFPSNVFCALTKLSAEWEEYLVEAEVRCQHTLDTVLHHG